MTEYDYSPEAYEQHLAKQARIARWVDKSNEYTPANPFCPLPDLPPQHGSHPAQSNSDHPPASTYSYHSTGSVKRHKHTRRHTDFMSPNTALGLPLGGGLYMGASQAQLAQPMSAASMTTVRIILLHILFHRLMMTCVFHPGFSISAQSMVSVHKSPFPTFNGKCNASPLRESIPICGVSIHPAISVAFLQFSVALPSEQCLQPPPLFVLFSSVPPAYSTVRLGHSIRSESEPACDHSPKWRWFCDSSTWATGASHRKYLRPCSLLYISYQLQSAKDYHGTERNHDPDSDYSTPSFFGSLGRGRKKTKASSRNGSKR
jgi:hypothetical protein